MHSDPGQENENRFQVVMHLVTAGNGDTLFRDLYLERARDLLAPLFPVERYGTWQREKEELAGLIHRSETAVDRGDWELARELATRIGALRNATAEADGTIKVAATIYDAPEVVIDPFSPGLHRFAVTGDKSAAEVREAVGNALAALVGEDPERGEFYRRRREALGTSPVEEEASSPAESHDPEAIRQAALKAVGEGNVQQFDRLVHLLGKEQAPEKPEREAGEVSSSEAPVSTLAGIDISRAGRLGFTSVTQRSAPEAARFLRRHAWQPSTSLDTTPDLQLSDIPELQNVPAEVRGKMLEGMGLFAIHPFVNSAGIRYLPPCEGEELLVEDFPETEGGENLEVPRLLGLPRRWGLSRRSVEQALFTKGSFVLREHLGLDPRRFRLVCIPADAYVRLGRERGWGNASFWTHFDGYQLLQTGALRALVGGDRRYGGIFDLCSIGSTDEREGVVARFAVVDRSRMAFR